MNYSSKKDKNIIPRMRIRERKDDSQNITDYLLNTLRDEIFNNNLHKLFL
jgi:hypothetical protein